MINNFIVQLEETGAQKQLVNVVPINGAASNANSQSNFASANSYTFFSSAGATSATSSSTLPPSTVGPTSTSVPSSSSKCDYRKVLINGVCEKVSDDCKEWE